MVSGVNDEMSALRSCVQEVVRRQAVRSGSVPNARKALAHRHKLAPGTWERAANGTHKRTDLALVRAVIAELQGELVRLEHDLQMLRQMGAEPASLVEAQTHLAAVRGLLS